MVTFDCATCYNPKPFKTNNHNGRWISLFQKIMKNPHSATC
jgi:hypothetical protein